MVVLIFLHCSMYTFYLRSWVNSDSQTDTFKGTKASSLAHCSILLNTRKLSEGLGLGRKIYLISDNDITERTSISLILFCKNLTESWQALNDLSSGNFKVFLKDILALLGLISALDVGRMSDILGCLIWAELES